MRSLIFKLLLVVVFILLAIPSYADKTTGLTTSSSAYASGSNGGIYSVDIVHDGTNSCTITIYSGNGAVSANAIFKGLCYASDSSSCSPPFIKPRPFRGGFYVVVSGTGCAYIVHYDINI